MTRAADQEWYWLEAIHIGNALRPTILLMALIRGRLIYKTKIAFVYLIDLWQSRALRALLAELRQTSFSLTL